MEKLIDKIRKILAVANHPNTNENEAAAAAALAQGLLEEHNLSLSQIEAAGGARAEGREKTTHGKAAMYKYQRDLMQALARNNFCHWWISETYREDPRGRVIYFPDTREWKKGRQVKTHFLVGRTSNVTTTKMVYEYLVETMDRILPYTGMEKRGKEALLWLAGCTERLVERLDALHLQAIQESERKAREDAVRSKHPGAAATANALTLVDVFSSEDDLNNDFIRGYAPGTTARNRREEEARSALREAKRQEVFDAAIARGLSREVAWQMKWGYSEEQAIAAVEQAAGREKAETARERQRRENQEERWRRQYWRDQTRESMRRDHPAFQAGKSAGDGIGLDRQVDQAARKGIK